MRIRQPMIEGVNHRIRPKGKPKRYKIDKKTYTIRLIPEEFAELNRIKHLNELVYEPDGTLPTFTEGKLSPLED